LALLNRKIQDLFEKRGKIYYHQRMKIKLFFFLISLLLFVFFFPFAKESERESIEKAKILFRKLQEEKQKEIAWKNLSLNKFLQPDFFEKIKNVLIEDKQDFLLVDLSAKKLTLFEKGVLKKEYQILSIGKEGSFWETPTGLFQIEKKFKNAFSNMGQVYMPYSLLFQGNFFIHGWPYYPDGTPVSSQFSGGCIRLANKDAKEIFEMVKIGTPVLIFESKNFEDNFSYTLRLPQVSAKNYLAVDLKNNFIFLAQDLEERLPIASITKLVSALVATEYINLWKKIEIIKSDLIYTSKPRLKEGETWTGFDLLYPLLLESSNEAAKAISRFLGEKNFVEAMNKKAKAMGMESAYFVDPAGISPENQASLKDLYLLSRYLYFNRHFILDITKGKIYHHLITKNFKDLKNLNCFSENENFVGGKIGKTKEAQETALSILEVEFKGEKRPIAIFVLGSADACKDSEEILNWIKNNFN
jgi:serine-type D-Ala-D-Ala carboxypeptidase (penicillin-binding protein 5/6)